MTLAELAAVSDMPDGQSAAAQFIALSDIGVNTATGSTKEVFYLPTNEGEPEVRPLP